MLFEIQLLKSQDAEFQAPGTETDDTKLTAVKPVASSGYEDFENTGGPEFSRDEASSLISKDKKTPQGLRSILLKGEMRYLKDVNMLVFLCSPL